MRQHQQVLCKEFEEYPQLFGRDFKQENMAVA
jgi:hypothetical protein